VLLGVTLSYIGPMEDSLRHLESASGMYVRERHAAHAYVYGQDPGMACVSYAAIPHWWLGFVVTAGQCVENAVSHARTLDHPRSLAFALANGARAQLKRGDYVRSAELGAEAADISGRHGFPDFLFMGSFHKLAAEHCATRDPDQIHAMHAALESLVEVGNSVSVPYYCSLVANALSENSQFEPAARLLDRADAILLKHGHDCDASEVCRARGLLQWRQGDPAAETVLRRAHDLAAREHGLSWRLQAATTLAKYLAQRNRAPDGRDMLREALDAMPERAYLPIFNEAEALIDEL
jgi:hypothetical protein